MPTLAPYGAWRSPITAETLLAATVGLSEVRAVDDSLYWLESRPQEQGRTVLVRRRGDGREEDLTPAPFNVRSRVHEYGGGAYLATPEQVFFSHYVDNRIYTLWPEPRPLSPEGNYRFSDFALDGAGHRLIAVCEDHSLGGEPENFLAAIDLKTGDLSKLASGADFYSSPRLSPDGAQLAWLQWNHPHLPWDQTELWLGDLTPDGGLANRRCVAGQGEPEAINEPRWAPGGDLFYVGELQGWWNLFRYLEAGAEPVYPLDAEFTYPHWIFGLSSYVFWDAQTLFCAYNQGGSWSLARLDLVSKQLKTLDLPYSAYSSLTTDGSRVYFLASSPTKTSQLCALDPATGQTEVLKRSGASDLDPRYFSRPQALSFTSEDGEMAYAWYYPPHNPDYQAPAGTLPPLLVKSHGGPTAQASNTLSLKVQYWTSRGFGYLDVDYRGSTGYGRAYRERLAGAWGVADVADCVAGARYLVSQGRVNPRQLAISGGSAGGYTTLAALTFYNVFQAGASYYGVGDLTALARDTHKFEARYLDKLIGPYPETAERYRQRSPLFHAERLACPVIFFQGLEDKVVPPNQAETMAAALQAKGVQAVYVAFPEEGHGFRRAENIKAALEGEFQFYAQVFGFEPT
ncbi:MAG: S9 family peptidase [Cyanobacteriota bacterium]|jgi:dipeptidyl aminopeptidase/acylaminoacyl peptidase